MTIPRLLAAIALALAPAAAHAADAAHPTVIELFQSQGCSSCPPANANVNALSARPDILALSFAVTYWDGLGWKDIFATPQNTARQWDYARAFGNDQVWTPQVVINGRANIVGSKRGPLEVLIAKTDRGAGGPAVAVAGNRVTISGTTAKPADIWLVRYDPRAIEVSIKAGENGGRTLPHRNIVRELVKLGRWTGGNASFALPASKLPGLATASFVQAGAGGPIIAAARGAPTIAAARG
ncbi:MAG: DUF1223 domain-containing protein [Polymorphobacter sp.]